MYHYKPIKLTDSWTMPARGWSILQVEAFETAKLLQMGILGNFLMGTVLTNNMYQCQQLENT